MAKNLQFQINYTGQGYLDSKTSVASISELAQKWDFEGQSVSMPTAFVGKNDIPYPIDFWLTPYGEIDKWEIKTMPAIESEEDLERFKIFAEDFKKKLEYYPMPIGFEFLANGEKYVFDMDENEAAVYTAAQTSMDELINHTVELAVDDAVNKITSGASEAFDTLKEVEEWIKENSGNTSTGPQGPQGEKGTDGKSAYDLWLEAGNEGSSEDFLASLKGEKGEQGERGEQGPQGEKGEQGERGEQGTDGKSAYDLWLEAGNEGSSEDFLASLKGERGEQGEKGALDEESVIALKEEIYSSAVTYTNNEISLVKEELTLVSGAVKSAIAEVVEELLIPENAKETLDTLEEISAWIQSHPEDAASMNAQIIALQESAHTHDNKGVLDSITADKVVAWDAAETNAKGYADDEIAKLSDVYAKKTDLEGLATETWVGEQGFLTEHQDITGKQDVIEDLEAIREGAAKGATALQEVPEGYATESWVGEQGFLTEHQDISGLATKEEVSDVVLSAQTYADSLVENLKPYDGGTAVDVVDYTVNVNVAEDGFLKVNEENELTVTGVTLDAAVTSKDITIEGGQWATAVKTVFTGGTVPAGTTWQSFLESMLCVEKFDTSYSMSKTFTVSCGTLGEGITGATNNSSVEVGTKVSLKSFEANPTTASQSYTVSTFDYGYKLGEDGTYNKSTSFKETLTPSLKDSNDALTATFTTFVDESGNTIAKISGNTSMGEVKMRVMDGTNKVVIAQTGDTYTASSAVTAGTIYVATNLKNYYKSDKKTPNTYTPSYASEDKTATASTTYTVTGYRNTFYGTTSKTDAADATFIRTLTKSNKAIAAGNTISFDTNSTDGHLRMVIASPRTIKSVKNQTGTQDLTALLVGTKATVSVGGVDNFAPISYNVYDYTWKGAFGNETWIITFA